MQVVGVIDLRAGRAVHARRGRRDEYQPVRVAAGEAIDGDAEALARAYVERLGVDEIYIADLDAIVAARTNGAEQRANGAAVGHHEDNTAVIRRIARTSPVWLDAAVSTPDAASHALELGAARLVVGLETLDSLTSLAAISARVGADRVVFSADLVNGLPLAPRWAGSPPLLHSVAAEAARLGISALIVLDLARVGSGEGPDVDLVRRVRAVTGTCPVFAGGGVRDEADLRQLADAGCDGVLLATALHEGAIARASAGRPPTDRSSPPLPSPPR